MDCGLSPKKKKRSSVITLTNKQTNKIIYNIKKKNYDIINVFRRYKKHHKWHYTEHWVQPKVISGTGTGIYTI